MEIKLLQQQFRDRFGGQARIFRAPGRVNLIGEHTDYNEGYVMPAAIDLSCWVAAAPRADQKIVIYSETVDETFERNLKDGIPPRSGTWSDYPNGVAVILQKHGYAPIGCSLYIKSNVPLGGGLSSSASVEVSTGYALLRLAAVEVDLVRLALMCQRAENEFVGARCGIMDQFTACHGKAGHALRLDCRSLEFCLVPLAAQVDLVICNTKVKHELASNEYNARRRECEEVTRRLAEVLPSVRSLRDVSQQQLEANRGCLDDTLFTRARHIVSENDRVIAAGKALESGELQEFGRLMRASHMSLRDDYEVSCPELDVMVDVALKQPGVYGARMTGGGFGGCTINLVKKEHTAQFSANVGAGYRTATGIEPEIYVCKASQGVQEILQ